MDALPDDLGIVVRDAERVEQQVIEDLVYASCQGDTPAETVKDVGAGASQDDDNDDDRGERPGSKEKASVQRQIDLECQILNVLEEAQAVKSIMESLDSGARLESAVCEEGQPNLAQLVGVKQKKKGLGRGSLQGQHLMGVKDSKAANVDPENMSGMSSVTDLAPQSNSGLQRAMLQARLEALHDQQKKLQVADDASLSDSHVMIKAMR
jgi:hypothetical protein